MSEKTNNTIKSLEQIMEELRQLVDTGHEKLEQIAAATKELQAEMETKRDVFITQIPKE